MTDGWPICGMCGEVAYFLWMGGPHQCLTGDRSKTRREDICDRQPPPGWTEGVGWTDEGIRVNFECQIEAALRGRYQGGCTLGVTHPPPYDSETSRALDHVALHQTSESVSAAYEELERQLDGTHARNANGVIEEVVKRLGYT